MKTIGIIGGMSWRSSADYYRLINTEIQSRLGGATSANLILFSLNLAEVLDLLDKQRVDLVRDKIITAARHLRDAGAEFLVLASNTPHRHADAIAAAVDVPLLHIADVTAAAIEKRGLRCVALVGTKTTMRLDFYKERLRRHGIEVISPDEAEMDAIDRIIASELFSGTVNAGSRDAIVAIARRLKGVGAGGLVLACTELPMLIDEAHVDMELFDTTALHTKAAVELALS